MKEIKVTKFQAWGGKVFDDRSECEAYEAANPYLIFVGLTAGQIEAALAAPEEGSDMGLALEFCNIADRIRAKLQRLDTPRHRGGRAFLSGIGGIVPDELRADKAASEEWLAGWDAESVKRRTAA